MKSKSEERRSLVGLGSDSIELRLVPLVLELMGEWYSASDDWVDGLWLSSQTISSDARELSESDPESGGRSPSFSSAMNLSIAERDLWVCRFSLMVEILIVLLVLIEIGTKSSSTEDRERRVRFSLRMTLLKLIGSLISLDTSEIGVWRAGSLCPENGPTGLWSKCSDGRRAKQFEHKIEVASEGEAVIEGSIRLEGPVESPLW
jgi:hypothetical protein